ncbi:universal stress protein [Desulfospira joergensenii]|uniref:universal stress protein n=1 Tax=Desulfospira joergensenii TaxID=53329 RepID=UPI0003B55128|nr:universal stress protein [Desulfospira joergensenii]
MIQKPKKILFASDLSKGMKQVFDYAASMAVYAEAEIIVLHVMEEASSSSEKRVRMAFGEELYKNIKNEHKTGARNLLIGKNVDALKIRQAISGFLEDETPLETESPIGKILVSESRSIADEVVSTAVDEDCDLIVMGCKQKGLLAEAMGSKLVRKVLKRTSVPVFIVPLAGE